MCSSPSSTRRCEIAAVKARATTGPIRLLETLQSEGVDLIGACGGRGLCATCHVRVVEGAGNLSAVEDRERRTLGRLPDADSTSRLSCQARVLTGEVLVALPTGRFIQSMDDLDAYIGKRTREPIRHPGDGRILIQKNKIITRSAIRALEGQSLELNLSSD